jgi:hypothetical protein
MSSAWSGEPKRLDQRRQFGHVRRLPDLLAEAVRLLVRRHGIRERRAHRLEALPDKSFDLIPKLGADLEIGLV